MHRHLSSASENTKVNDDDADIRISYTEWQRILAVQMVLARYVRAVAEWDTPRGYAIARATNPLASVCGRICAHPCESQCRRVRREPVDGNGRVRFDERGTHRCEVQTADPQSEQTGPRGNCAKVFKPVKHGRRSRSQGYPDDE
jgi:hypothetical protein